MLTPFFAPIFDSSPIRMGEGRLEICGWGIRRGHMAVEVWGEGGDQVAEGGRKRGHRGKLEI